MGGQNEMLINVITTEDLLTPDLLALEGTGINHLMKELNPSICRGLNEITIVFEENEGPTSYRLLELLFRRSRNG